MPSNIPDISISIICRIDLVESPQSLPSSPSQWLPEIKRYAPDTEILLVGTKKDLREDQDIVRKLAARKLAPVTVRLSLPLPPFLPFKPAQPTEAAEMRKTIGAIGYLEVVTTEHEDVLQLLQLAVKKREKMARAGGNAVGNDASATCSCALL